MFPIWKLLTSKTIVDLHLEDGMEPVTLEKRRCDFQKKIEIFCNFRLFQSEKFPMHWSSPKKKIMKGFIQEKIWESSREKKSRRLFRKGMSLIIKVNDRIMGVLLISKCQISGARKKPHECWLLTSLRQAKKCPQWHWHKHYTLLSYKQRKSSLVTETNHTKTPFWKLPTVKFPLRGSKGKKLTVE